MSENLFEKRYLREKEARREAERLLEEKAHEIFERNQELESLKTHLEFLVELRTKEAYKATEDAVQANRAKSQFLANMSHEIRTPLTAIIGYAEILRRDKLNADVSDSHLTTIINNGRHLTELLSEILDLSKIETQNLVLESRRFNLPDLLAELRQLHQVNANSKSIQLNFHFVQSIPMWVVGDPTRLKQVLHNLLSNAIKFTNKGEITLSVNTQWSNNQIVFKVRDTGEGISEEQQQHIFDSFRQADASITRKYGGTGLGLSIAKSLIHLMGGDLTVSSKLNTGSEFTASIVVTNLEGKCQKMPSSIDRKTMSTKAEVPKLMGKVLLVEDTFVNQQLISNNIEITGAKVVVAENGQQAIEQAMSEEFDLVLMDIQMPVLDGKEAFKGLKQLGYNKPVYALTANVMQSDTEEYLQLGFNGTLAKPLDLSKFYEVLKRHLTISSEQPNQKNDIPAALQTKIVQLKPLFLKTLKEQRQQISQHVAHSDFEKIGKILHIIKGSAGSFGYNSLTDIANNALKSIRTENFDTSPELISNVILNIDNILNSEE